MQDEVQLRDVTQEDLAVFFEHQRDPEAVRVAAFPGRDRDTFMAHWTRILADPSVLTRTIVVGDDVAGNVVTFERNGEREVGYWIGREFWGQGVATRALVAFLRLDAVRPLYARVAEHNRALIRVLQKCGFTIVDAGGSPPPPDDVEEVVPKLEAVRSTLRG